MKEVKCEHCGFWTNGMLDDCNYCGKRLNDKHLSEIEEREQIELRGMPLLLEKGRFISLHGDCSRRFWSAKNDVRFGLAGCKIGY